MSALPLAGIILGIGLCAMLLLWLLSLVLRDASIVDIWWGPGFVLLAAASYALVPTGDILVVALVAAWGLRLGAYLFWRNAGHGEDPRYQAMRRHHGARFPLVSLATVFGLQGALQWFVALPVIVAQAGSGEWEHGALGALGIALYLVGLVFETVGDWQLARFKSDPKNAGAVMDRGLWRYTRHPNYFGDACIWWGIWLVCLQAPGVWLTVASPIVMSIFLMRISGVPMLERSIGKRRPGYAEYQRRTSTFFPRPPRP